MDNEETAKVLRGLLALTRRLRAERPESAISPAALSILAALFRRGPMSGVALAAEQRLRPQSLTRLLAALERAELIERQPDPADRRNRVIALTRRGRGAFAAEMRARREWLEAAMAATLSAAEQASLLETAGAMLKLADYEAAAEPEAPRPAAAAGR